MFVKQRQIHGWSTYLLSKKIFMLKQKSSNLYRISFNSVRKFEWLFIHITLETAPNEMHNQPHGYSRPILYLHSAKRVRDCRQNIPWLLWNALLTTPYVSVHYKYMFLVARDLYEVFVLYRRKHTTRRSTVGIWSEVQVYLHRPRTYRGPATCTWASFQTTGAWCVKSICKHHYMMYLSKYNLQWKKCYDPFAKHKKNCQNRFGEHFSASSEQMGFKQWKNFDSRSEDLPSMLVLATRLECWWCHHQYTIIYGEWGRISYPFNHGCCLNKHIIWTALGITFNTFAAGLIQAVRKKQLFRTWLCGWISPLLFALATRRKSQKTWSV